jgi:hypothetical protein
VKSGCEAGLHEGDNRKWSSETRREVMLQLEILRQSITTKQVTTTRITASVAVTSWWRKVKKDTYIDIHLAGAVWLARLLLLP